MPAWFPPAGAYKDQRLQNLNGHLVIYGDPVMVPGSGKGFPILDAFTLQQLKDPTGRRSVPVSEIISTWRAGE